MSKRNIVKKLSLRELAGLAPKAKPKRTGKRSSAQAKEYDIAMFESAGLPKPLREVRFHPVRKWRFDLAWPQLMVALEIEGGAFGFGHKCRLCGRRQVGRHNTASGFAEDMEKYRQAAILGWRIIRCTPKEYNSMLPVVLLRDFIHQNTANLFGEATNA